MSRSWNHGNSSSFIWSITLFQSMEDHVKRDFINDLRVALAESGVKGTIQNTVVSYTEHNAASQISSFGVGIGLAFLGQYLATRKIRSPTARFIARILGAKVDAINRDYILQKLKDEGYAYKIRREVLNVIQTYSIDEFARAVGLSRGEAWEVYTQIKDLILDSVVIGI